MTHNKKEMAADELFELLQSIEKFMEKPVNMYALGGTALTILNIKKSTLDIDINIGSQKEYKYVCKIFEQIGFEKTGVIRWRTQEGLAFDLFHSSSILETHLLDDCLELSKFIKSFGNINLYTISMQDIIISKLARGDERDLDDIKMIFENQDIDLSKLVNRYKETMENSVVAQYRQKLIDLIHFKFKEWNCPIDEKIIKEVEKWETD